MMKSMKSMMMGGAILLGLAMCLTSCEGTLDDIFGEWSRPTGNNGNTKTTVAVKSVTLDQTTLTKAVGDDAVTLTATVDPSDASDKTVTWKSSDASIAAVDANGKVTFVAAGSATITATATNGTEDTADDKTATCTVTVANPDKYISVASDKKVQFATGNLQAKTNDLGSTWTWTFATNQWEYIGNAAGNNSINGNGTVSANGTVDLFGWVGASSSWTGAAIYGISNSADVSDYGTSDTEALKSDWGTNKGTGWRTLSADEWSYLLNTRSAMKIGTTDDARYVKATVHGIKGLIIFPNQIVWIETTMGDAPTTCNTGDDNFTYAPNDDQWTVLETAGCVFLPAAGNRYSNTVLNVQMWGYYWSSSATAGNSTKAQVLGFSNYNMSVSDNDRSRGYSVRLVQDVTP